MATTSGSFQGRPNRRAKPTVTSRLSTFEASSPEGQIRIAVFLSAASLLTESCRSSTPATAATQVQLNCDPTNPTSATDPTSPNYNPAVCAIPIGGFTLWEASAEFRFNIPGPLDAAAFCDSGDVSQIVGPAGLRGSYLHMSCGIGARYDTPLGPIRLDLGYRIPFLQVLGRLNEQDVFTHDPTQGCPPRLFGTAGVCTGGIPAAVAFGIGEAF